MGALEPRRGMPVYAAIGMLASQLSHHPAWTTADLAAELAAARDRLTVMHAENLSVAAAFELSYQDLTAAQQLFFRRLGLQFGPIDFSPIVAILVLRIGGGLLVKLIDPS